MSLVSVIIPVHNTARYLRKCIDSVANQTLKDIEIILVENLSTDGSFEICEEYSRIDARIRVIRLDVADLSSARNAGIRLATSPYVGFVDSDDYIAPDMYESMLKVLQDSNAEIVYGNLCYESEKGEMLGAASNKGDIRLKSRKEALQDVFKGIIDSSVCSKLFKKELFETVPFQEGYLFEDHGIIYKLIDLSRVVVHIDRAFYHYVQHEGSITSSWKVKKYYYHFLADYGRLEFIRENHVYEGEEQRKVVSGMVSACLTLFRDAMLVADKAGRREFIPEMKQKLKQLLPAKDELSPSVYRRLNKMLYLAPLERIFFLLRYKIKGEKMRRPFAKSSD